MDIVTHTPSRPRRAGSIITSANSFAVVLLAASALLGPFGAASARAEIDAVVDKILTRLERRSVRDLHAKLTWKLTYAVEEESDTKLGEIWYQEFDPVAKFLVHFTHQITTRKRALDEKHLFDGRWYVELQGRTKTVTRREIRSEEDKSNPYKIGEGVFPLPFGQKKEDILREFEVRRVEPAQDDPPACDHLVLIPRETTQSARNYRQLSFWVSREGPHAGLPVKVLAAKKDGTGEVNSYIEITFRDVRLNEGFSASVFRVETPPGYEEYVERLEASAAPAPLGASATGPQTEGTDPRN